MLTERQLKALTTTDAGKKISDAGALWGKVRTLADGSISVSFWYRYRFSEKIHDLACGAWPKKSLKEIRSARDKAKLTLADGQNPSAVRKAQKQQAVTDAIAVETMDVSSLFEQWAAIDLVRRKDGGKEIRRMFAKDVLPAIGQLRADEVTKRHVALVVDALLARGVPRMAKMILSLIRQMFRFAQDRDIVAVDPTAAIRKARIGGRDTERDRVLSDREIRLLAEQLPTARLLDSTEKAIWICLSTCCRIGELLNARWSDVNFSESTWRIPAENSKNGRPHEIWLSPFAADQFLTLQAISGDNEWIYPDRTESNPVCVKTVTKQIGDRQRSVPRMSRRSTAVSSLLLPGGKWTPHDLRRTGATIMAMLGVIPEVAERCLNHTEESRMKRIYQRHSYDAEKREAWRRLGIHLTEITTAAGQ